MKKVCFEQEYKLTESKLAQAQKAKGKKGGTKKQKSSKLAKKQQQDDKNIISMIITP